MTALDPRSPVPKYHQLRDILLELVEQELAVNAPIPSERELSEKYGVSRMTVRQAVDGLVAEGRLYRVAGRGTFVDRPKMDVQVRLTSFTEDMRSRGMRASSTTLALERVPASPSLARELEIDVGQLVVRLERLRYADGIPMSVEKTHLPDRLVPGLVERGVDSSLYELLTDRYGLALTWGEQTIEAGLADPASAGLLEIPADGVVMRMRRHAYAGDVRVEFALSTYRADRYALWVPLQQPTAPYRRTIPHPSGHPTLTARPPGGTP